MVLSWCVQLKGNMVTDPICTGTSLFLPLFLSFWQLWYATFTHIYSETSYTKTVLPHNLSQIPHLEINHKVHQQSNQNSNLPPVSYNPMEVERSLSSLPTLHKQWLEAEISNRKDNRDGRGDWTASSSSYPAAQRRNKGNPRTRDGECTVLLYVSANLVCHERKYLVISVLTQTAVNCGRCSCTERRCVVWTNVKGRLLYSARGKEGRAK